MNICEASVCVVTENTIIEDTGEYRLVCVVSGTVVLVNESEEKTLATGDAVFLYNGFSLKSSMPFTILCVANPEKLFSDKSFILPARTSDGQLRVFYPTPTTSALSAEIVSLLQDSEYTDSGNFAIKQYLCAVYAAFFIQSDGEKDEKSRVLCFINSNFLRNLSTENMAEALKIDKARLARIVKKETGMTLHGFITEKRLEYSAELLESGKNVNEVSTLCGYGDYSTFFRAYKKKYGTSPQEKRK